MSFSHKAYSMDWDAFQTRMAPLLEEALRSNDPAKLIVFIDQHREECSDPYEGAPLQESWQEGLGARDVQEYADYALTYCYSPANDFGLCEAWSEVDAACPQSVRPALLGTAFGPPDALFDPGRMGSYIQAPSQVRWSVSVLAELSMPVLGPYLEELRQVVKTNRGLYVTF